MELIAKSREAATLKLSSREYAMLSAILMVFEHKMENDKIDFAMLMESKEDTQKFLDDFTAIFEGEG